MQAECAYFQAIADLLSEEEDTASPWFWPEWHMLFHAIMISRLYANCQLPIELSSTLVFSTSPGL